MSRKTPKALTVRPDAANLPGITDFVNRQNVKPGLDPRAVEEKILGVRQELDPVKLAQDELDAISGALGIKFDPVTVPEPPGGGSAPLAPPPVALPAARAPVAELDLDSALEVGTKGRRKRQAPSNPSTSSRYESEYGSDDSDDSDDSDGSDEYDSEYASEYGSDEYEESDSSSSSHRKRKRGDRARSDRARSDRGRDERVDELGQRLGLSNARPAREPVVVSRHHRHVPSSSGSSRRRRHRDPGLHAENILAELRQEVQTVPGAEAERLRKQEVNQMEEINQLITALEEEDFDLSSVHAQLARPDVDREDVLRILRRKNESNRYSSIASEAILSVAELLGDVFDGTRTVPLLGVKPDYTGYHTTVEVKLRRMKVETSQVVSQVLDRVGGGPWTRIGLELLPSLLLYPRQNARRKRESGAYAREAFGAAAAADPRGRLPALT